MIYVALLRGINVGGNNKVEMKRLQEVLVQSGIQSVKTYINSGNVIFKDEKRSPDELANLLESVIEKEFGFSVKVLLRDIENIRNLVKTLPPEWKNDTSMKCDVMFLWDSFDNKEILNSLSVKPEIDDVIYVPGAILWRVDRVNVTRSGMMKLVGTDIYKHMTIRNCNTARKLLDLMEDVQ